MSKVKSIKHRRISVKHLGNPMYIYTTRMISAKLFRNTKSNFKTQGKMKIGRQEIDPQPQRFHEDTFKIEF